MKLVIFGATGKIGRHLVTQALEQGHDVTAFVRNPNKMKKAKKGLTIVKGDVLDPATLKKGISGRDAVICALGMPLFNKEGLRAQGTKNIIKVMEETGVKRLVCLSGLGAGESRKLLPASYKYFIVPLFMRHLYADHNRQEVHVKGSSLDWVIARPASFTKGKHTGQYRHGFSTDEPIALKISHADVADFMLTQLVDNTYLHQAPCLSY